MGRLDNLGRANHTGLGSRIELKAGRHFQAEHAHNDLLEHAIDFGTPSALALTLILGGAVVLCSRGNSADTPARILRRGARSASLAGVLVHGLVSFPLHSPASACIALLVAGRCWSRVGRQCGPSPTTRVMAALLFATLPLALWIGSREIRGQSALYDARRALASQDCASAIDLTGQPVERVAHPGSRFRIHGRPVARADLVVP